MTTAIVHARRSWLPGLALLVAGGAAALSLVAITTDDVATTTAPRTPAPAEVPALKTSPADVPVYERMPAGWPATEVMRQAADPATQLMRRAGNSDCSNGPAHGPTAPC
jgi:hypothetical protein